MIRLLVVVGALLASANSKTVQKRADSWLKYNGAEYLFVKQAKSWDDALAHCKSRGSTLATPEGPAENTWVAQQAKAAGLASPWIGVNDKVKENIFRRPDGTVVSYKVFAPNEPNQSGGNEDCVQLYEDRRQWNDLPCNLAKHFICKKTGCSAKQADIVFVVDASGSVGISNFRKQLQFVEDVINTFEVGQDKVRIGMVTFDSDVYKQFHLNEFNDKAAMINKVRGTTYTRRGTETWEAVQYILAQSFTPANGARSGVPHIAIFLTDGRSTNPSRTISEAAKLHANNINVFAIGIGSNLNSAELNALGTDPDSESVFKVADFNALNAIKNKLMEKTCKAPVIPTKPGPVVVKPTPPVLPPTLKPFVPMKVVGAPDNKGTRFIFAFGENWSFGDINDLEVFITTFENGPVNVKVSSPLYNNPKVSKSVVVNKGEVKQVKFSNLLRLKETNKENKAILVESDKEVVVYAFNKEKASVDGFLALPVDILGTEYFTSSYSPAFRKTEIQIVGAYDNTNVMIQLLNPKTGTVTWNGKTYKAGDTINVPLNQYQTFQLQSTGDLTGTRITADKPIAVLSGNIKTSVSSNGSQDHLVEMLPPTSTWGKNFVTTATPDRNDGDVFRVIASKPNTKVTIPGVGTYTLAKAGDYKELNLPSDKSYKISGDKPLMLMQFAKTSDGSLKIHDPSMTMIPPVGQWGSHYTFATPQGINGNYKNFINIQIRKDDVNGLYLNGRTLPANTKWTPVAGTNFVTAQVPITHGTYEIQHTNPTVTFGTTMYGAATDESYGFPAGLRLAGINMPCKLTPVVVGDGIDNDCDGRIDEELPNSKDDDGDGKVDEDLAKTIGLVTPPPSVCGTNPADVVFLLDNSGSVGSANFKKQLDFIKSVANNFEIAPDKVRIGIVKFSTGVQAEFHLRKYSTKSSLMAAIDKIKFTGGYTNTGDALKYMHETAFNPLNGDRPGVVNIGIVMTDGKSTNKPLTLSEAAKAKQKGIDMVSIGIGTNLAQDELKAIASNNKQVYKADSFDALKNIEAKLTKLTCEVPKVTTAPPVVPTSKVDCDIQADVMFLLDTSGSVGGPNFKKITNFVKEVSGSFDIGATKTRVGVVKYSTNVKPEFNMLAHKDKTSLLAAIDGVAFTGGITETAKGIKYLTDTSFTPREGDRPGVPDIAIIVTDGKSNRKSATKAEAKRLQDKGVKVFAIGIGKGISMDELNAIGSDPDNAFVYSVDTFDALKGFKDMFSTQACKVVPNKITNTATTPAPIKDCDRPADFVFVLDSSGSVGKANFQKMLSFVNKVVDELNIAKDKAQVGVMRYSDRAYLDFHLNKYDNKPAVKTAVSNVQYKRGGTNTAQAIKYMREQMFNPGNGARKGVPHIGIVITDGESISSSKTIAEANNARKQGITMYAIGVGKGVKSAELKGIGNDPDSDYVFPVDNFDVLDTIKKQLALKACAPKPTQPPTTLDPNRCRDRIPNCDHYSRDTCTNFVSWANKNCKMFCGLCPPTIAPPEVITITPPAVCVDKVDNCASYGSDFCTDYKDFAADKCPRFCGFCSGVNTITGGYFNKCYYKGSQYNTGDTWKDGCDYECTCDDARQGLYTCNNMCPVYYNLPKQCVLTKVPGECCKKPVCDFGPSVVTTTGHGKGKQNGLDVCVYDGQKYYQGMTWQDGCDKECRCLDASSGYYTCQSLCPIYSNVPSVCKLVSQPGKCCDQLVCDWPKQVGTITGSGQVTGPSTQVTKPKPPTVCSDKLPNCDAYGKSMCSNPDFVSWASGNCAKYCDLCKFAVDPCFYKGRQYQQGQTWADGCRQCVCEDSNNGYFRCYDNCPVYTNLPSQCKEVKKDGECCSKVECGYGTFVPSTTGTIKPGTGTGIVVTGNTTPPPGTVVVPPGTVTNIEGCMYNGKLYKQGVVWEDGCDYICECIDGKAGRYKCGSKCPIWNNLPATCSLQDMPGDQCCQYPVCTGTVTPGTIIPTFPKGITGTRPVVTTGTGTGTIVGPVPTLKPGTVTKTPPVVKNNVCVYKGKNYNQGQKWVDLCNYDCECVDASTGFYRCSDRCVTYSNLPSSCRMVTNADDPCCKIPKCDFTTVRPTPPVATVKPPTSMNECVYPDGRKYSQGQQWNDGCALKCTCEDAKTGYYRCQNRCPSYTSIPPNCKLVTDPNDPTCCKVPQCDLPTGTNVKPGTVVTPTGVVGTFTGTGKPVVTTNTGTVGSIKDVCVYNDQVYRQGDRWEDGCLYSCECINAPFGQYRCTDKCPRYPALPKECKLVVDPFNPCCQKPQCTVTTGTGTGTNVCRDVLDNCADYGNDACSSTYEGWARENCAKRCGYCGRSTAVVPPTPTKAGPTVPLPAYCQDSIPNCQDYGSYVCSGDYLGWAIDNCPRTCRLCAYVSTRGPIVATTTTKATPKPRSFCEYKGKKYTTGATWDDNCQYSCTCENEDTGLWKCTEKCPVWQTLPKECIMNPPLPNNCCPYPVCRGGKHTIIYPTGTKPETGVSTGTPGGISVPGTGKVITGIGSVTNRPQVITATTKTPVQTSYCVYKGTNYGQGASWVDGCQYTCTCENARTGLWKCTEMCPVFQNLPSACKMSPPLPGKCCSYPSCPDGYTIIYPKGTKPETGVSTGTPGGIVVPGTGTAITGTGSVTNKPITVTVAPSLVTKYCVYKGKNYGQGSTWDDGCQYTCSCENANTGQWKCVEKCPKWTSLPAGCSLAPPSLGNCCAYPKCGDGYTIIWPTGTKPETGVSTGKPGGIHVTGTGTAVTGVGSVTNKPITITVPPITMANGCTYKGTSYKEGQTWDDGCTYSCVCEDGKTGQWKCKAKCPSWNNLPSACSLSPPLSGNCCSYPKCPSGYTIIYPNGYKPEPGVTTGTGGGTVVTGTGGSGGSTGTGTSITTGCMYTDGTVHKVGETWADGCKYYCTCKDTAGNYECRHRCLQWTLPAQCRLDIPISGFCCGMPRCTGNVKINYPAGYEKETGFYGNGNRYIPGGTGNGGNGGTGSTKTVSGSLSTRSGTATVAGTGYTSGCLFNNKVYSQNSQWEDGCSYICTCINGATGQYTCNARCITWSLPDVCRIMPPMGARCCSEPSCPTGYTISYPSGYNKNIYFNRGSITDTGRTVVSSTAGCTYTDGSKYKQGETWKTGCTRSAMKCTCDDGATGRYTCRGLCPTWTSLPSSCKIGPPRPGKCCPKPDCPSSVTIQYPPGYVEE